MMKIKRNHTIQLIEIGCPRPKIRSSHLLEAMRAHQSFGVCLIYPIMYPSAPNHDQEKYGTEQGHPIHSPRLAHQQQQQQQQLQPVYNINPQYVSHGHSARVVGIPWQTGLCHCCDDPANCFITSCCPCITFGQIAEIVNKGESSCATQGALYGLLLMTGFSCLYSCFYRSKLRGQYDLEEAPCVDCLVHFCCETCALCQEYRELKRRGYDMGIGWEANMERQSRGSSVTMAPVVAQGMSR